MEGIDSAYISKCLYHPDDAPLCPIFKLGDIVKLSGFNFDLIAQMVSTSSDTCMRIRADFTAACIHVVLRGVHRPSAAGRRHRHRRGLDV